MPCTLANSAVAAQEGLEKITPVRNSAADRAVHDFQVTLASVLDARDGEIRVRGSNDQVEVCLAPQQNLVTFASRRLILNEGIGSCSQAELQHQRADTR